MDDALPDEPSELISRPPQREDVVSLCRELFAVEGRLPPE